MGGRFLYRLLFDSGLSPASHRDNQVLSKPGSSSIGFLFFARFLPESMGACQFGSPHSPCSTGSSCHLRTSSHSFGSSTALQYPYTGGCVSGVLYCSNNGLSTNTNRDCLWFQAV